MYCCVEIESKINPKLKSFFYYDAGKDTTYKEAVEDIFMWYAKAKPHCDIHCIYEISKSLYVSCERFSYRNGINLLKKKEQSFIKELKKNRFKNLSKVS